MQFYKVINLGIKQTVKHLSNYCSQRDRPIIIFIANIPCSLAPPQSSSYQLASMRVLYKTHRTSSKLSKWRRACWRCSMLKPSWPGDFSLNVDLIGLKTSLAVNLVLHSWSRSLLLLIPVVCPGPNGDLTRKLHINIFAMHFWSLEPFTLTGSPGLLLSLFVAFQKLKVLFRVVCYDNIQFNVPFMFLTTF